MKNILILFVVVLSVSVNGQSYGLKTITCADNDTSILTKKKSEFRSVTNPLLKSNNGESLMNIFYCFFIEEIKKNEQSGRCCFVVTSKGKLKRVQQLEVLGSSEFMTFFNKEHKSLYRKINRWKPAVDDYSHKKIDCLICLHIEVIEGHQFQLKIYSDDNLLEEQVFSY